MADRHLFFGGNTPDGFYSYYDNVLNSRKDNRLIILKGGPGVGKSSFVKAIAKVFKQKGHAIEYLHCSGDGDSLDGICIPKIQVAIIDGTAPHMIDPKIPGAFDEIINLGRYLDQERLIPYRQEIQKANQEKARCYKSAYRCLKAAQIMDSDSRMAYEDCLDRKALREITNHVIRRTLPAEQARVGNVRKLFASAITPEGAVSYIDTLIKGTSVIALKGEAAVSSQILGKLCQEAILSGYDAEACYCPMYPDQIEHLILPELGTSIVSLHQQHPFAAEAAVDVDVDQALNRDALAGYLPIIAQNAALSEQLLERAYERIKRAKESHKKIEQYYISAMDFDGVGLEREALLQRIMKQYA